MTEKYVSSVHVQKLGHHILEIRERALTNIISKLDNGFLYDNDLARSKQILQKLFEWFLFEEVSSEDVVLTLIKRIIQTRTGDVLLKHQGYKSIIDELNQVRSCVESKYYGVIDDIVKYVEEKMRNDIPVPPLESEFPLSYRSENIPFSRKDYVESTATPIEGYIFTRSSKDPESGIERVERLHLSETDSLQTSTPSDIDANNSVLPNYTLCWQPLISTDRHVLESVENSLRNPGESSVVLHTCEFFVDVMLHDFPPEVFLQRPAIINELRNLFTSLSSFRIKSAILNCFIKLTQCLQVRINYYSDPCIHNLKQYRQKIPVQSLQSSPNSITPRSNTRSSTSSGTQFTEEVHSLKIHEIPTPIYCLNTLNCVLHYFNDLSNIKDVEVNRKKQTCIQLALQLTHGLTNLLRKCLTGDIWHQQNMATRFMLDLIRNTLTKFGDVIYSVSLETISNDFEPVSRLIQISLLNTCLELLKSAIPSEKSDTIIPNNLKNALSFSLLDATISTLYPSIHSVLLEYVKCFGGKYENDTFSLYRELDEVHVSMKSAVKILKRTQTQSFSDTLTTINKSLKSLEYHRNLSIINQLIDLCANRGAFTSEKDEIISEMMVYLLSHHDNDIKSETYRLCKEKIISAIGPKLNMLKSGVPGSHIQFLLHSSIIIEIILNGLDSENIEIQQDSEDIIIHLLKCKILVSDDIWNKFIEVLILALPALASFVNKDSPLGRTILHILDPDKALSFEIPSITIYKGNLTFLFNKDPSVRNEAISRLCWLVSLQDKQKMYLPRIKNFSDKALNLLCCINFPFDVNKPQISQNYYQASSLEQVLELLTSENVEPVIRRSAMTQISVMTEDCSLHKTFLEKKGVDIVLNVIKSALTESCYKNYPDSVIPGISVLKNLCLHNFTVRQELSNNTEIFYFILRALFLYSTEERMKNDGSILLFVLLFGDYIKGSPSMANLSLPKVILKQLQVPFLCHSYSYNVNQKTEILRQNDHCLLSLKILWNSLWFGGFKKLISWKEVAYNEDFSKALRLTPIQLRQLQCTSLEFCMNNCFEEVQSSSDHVTVVDAVIKLFGYTNLYLSLTKESRVELDILSLPWKKTFSRFLNVGPSSEADNELLLHILQLLQMIIPLYKTKGVQNWISDEFSNATNSLLSCLKINISQNSDIKQLNQELLSLVASCVKSEQHYIDFYEVSPKRQTSWLHIIESIAENLQLNDTQHFYNLAYLDCLLSCLVHLTASLGWSNLDVSTLTKTLLIRLTTGLCELIGTFHCGKGPAASESVMGLSITRNAVLILNHLLMEMQRSNVNDWESCFTEEESGIENNLLNLSSLWSSRDAVLRAAVFQLFTGLFSSRSCIVEMVDGFKVEESHDLKGILLTLFLDPEEASLVREHVGNMLTNYIRMNIPGPREKCIDDFLTLLNDHNFYKNIEIAVLSLCASNTFCCNNNLLVSATPDTKNNRNLQTNSCNYRQSSDEELLAITTPGLLKSFATLLLNLIVLSPQKVTACLLEHNLIKLLFRSLIFPNGDILTTKDLALYCNVMEMNVAICTLLMKCVKYNSLCSVAILNTRDCLNCTLSLLNVNIYHTTLPQLVYLRNRLWCRIFDLLAALLENPGEDGKSSETLEIVLTESVQEQFLQTLCESINCNESTELQQSALCSLTSLLSIQSDSENNFRSNSLQQLLDQTCTPRTGVASIKDNQENISPNFKIDFISDKLTSSSTITSNTTNLMAGAEICRILLHILAVTNLKVTKPNLKKKVIIMNSLTNILCVSKQAKKYALDNGLLLTIVKQLKDLYFKLSVESTDSLRRISDKKRLGPVLNELSSLVVLLNNFMVGSLEIKTSAAELGLADIVHKHWGWFCAVQTLLTDALKMLCTFTTNSSTACQSLSMTSSVAGSGPKRAPSNMSLVHVVVSLIAKEMDLISRTHDLTILRLCFHLLHNSCCSVECRTILAKSSLLQYTSRLHPCITKKQKPWENVELIWLEFLQTFSSHQEGQATIAKVPDVLDLIITLTGTNKTENRKSAMVVLRNISFYPTNRPRLLACGDFLKTLGVKLTSGSLEDKNIVVTIMWFLAANNQKGKLVLKCAGLDQKLHEALKIIHLSDEYNTIDHSDLERMHYVLRILRESDK